MVECIAIEVARAFPDRQEVLALTVPRGTTAAEAVALAGWSPAAALGVFSWRVQGDHVLADGDRVEVYRPLTLDPKEARRRRASGR
ncbi:RnfH family protein [Pinirhizobacter soli]|uniref:RnfH family protein n=1 Tax=Pinirhizobacter soli TaxID=2786953 RepID=UPI00202A1C2B|nr:RnfH family protein [Pinirhizobacter soli]